MKISARNQLSGKIVGLTTGATTTHVRIEIAPRLVITAAITNESAKELELAIGMSATAIVKSSDVIVGTGV